MSEKNEVEIYREGYINGFKQAMNLVNNIAMGMHEKIDEADDGVIGSKKPMKWMVNVDLAGGEDESA